jgi:hypothetical protein
MGDAHRQTALCESRLLKPVCVPWHCAPSPAGCVSGGAGSSLLAQFNFLSQFSNSLTEEWRTGRPTTARVAGRRANSTLSLPRDGRTASQEHRIAPRVVQT